MTTSDDAMNERIERVRAKLAARGGGLEAPVPETTVGAFERRHGIVLPDTYRRFLTQIGNSGVGPPEYDLVGLGEAPSDMRGAEREKWVALPDVARPFPFTRRWVWEADEESLEGTLEQVDHGSLCLGTDGCGMNWHLVVTGPERGNIWFIAGEGIVPTSPRRDFLDCYEAWLDGVRSWVDDEG